MGCPNSTEIPNIPLDTNHIADPTAVEVVVEGYDRLMHRLVGAHAAQFTELTITMAQAKLVYVVVAGGSLHLAELATRLGIGSSSASEQVDRLVELDLLRRTEDPADRRQVVVTPTPTGGRDARAVFASSINASCASC